MSPAYEARPVRRHRATTAEMSIDPCAEIEWGRIGVTWQQVEELHLPGTHPKKPYGYPLAVEAEALPPQMLRDLLDAEVRSFVDQDALMVLEAAEVSERQVLERIAATAGGSL